MKRILSFILCAVMLLSLLSLPVQGAAASSYAGAVTTDGAPLNVRAKASTASSVVATLRKGSYITLLSKTGSWWQVEYGKNQTGYCHSDYITPVQGSPVTVTAANALNVRSGPGTSNSRVATLYNGEVVLLLTSANGWSRVLYHGTKTGYVSSQYLSGGEVSGSGVISLSVPSFKQADSRWGSVTIGTSGKTMAAIGCATTAIAMMESYRTGRTIYPDAMAKQLSYTPTGSVYWPSHYTVTTSASGYLNKIHGLLKQGKPVLFGAKKSSGSQHWVVITGFTGGTVTAANFTIHDPGTGTRTNLQQFLSSYPNFYKFFHY